MHIARRKAAQASGDALWASTRASISEVKVSEVISDLSVALSLINQALSMLDDPAHARVAAHLQAAINTAVTNAPLPAADHPEKPHW
jgi:hypothetical protein